mgnify:CR=1 FL=1
MELKKIFEDPESENDFRAMAETELSELILQNVNMY